MKTETTEARFIADIFWTVEELQMERLAHDSDEVDFYYSDNADAPSGKQQRRIMDWLINLGALTPLASLYPAYSPLTAIYDVLNSQPVVGKRVKINDVIFTPLRKLLDERGLNPATKLLVQIGTLRRATPVVDSEEQKMTSGSEKYFITLEQRKVILNGTFVLSSHNFESENDKFMDYVHAHPNKVLTKADIEKSTGKLKKDLHAIVLGLGFKGEIRKIFFDVSKVSILFRNEVQESELQKKGIDRNKLKKELSDLESFDQKAGEMVSIEEE